MENSQVAKSGSVSYIRSLLWFQSVHFYVTIKIFLLDDWASDYNHHLADID